MDDLVEDGELLDTGVAKSEMVAHVGSVGVVVERMGANRGVRGELEESDTGETDGEVEEVVDSSVVLMWEGLREGIGLAPFVQTVVEERVECMSSWVLTFGLGVVFSIVLQGRQSVYGGGHRY